MRRILTAYAIVTSIATGDTCAPVSNDPFDTRKSYAIKANPPAIEERRTYKTGKQKRNEKRAKNRRK